MGARRSEIGLDGERRARLHLEALGYRILAARWRCRLGELDLVAEDPADGGTIVFVEVRARSRRDRGLPEETVGTRKRIRLARLAAAWLAAAGPPEPRPCRFDVIALAPPPGAGTAGGPLELVHHRDAFPAAGA